MWAWGKVSGLGLRAVWPCDSLLGYGKGMGYRGGMRRRRRRRNNSTVLAIVAVTILAFIVASSPVILAYMGWRPEAISASQGR